MVGVGNPKGVGNPHWQKGVAINPGGRSKELARLQSAARHKAARCTPEAIAYLLKVLRNEAEATPHRLKAAVELLNRGLGLPQTQVDIDVVVRKKIGEMSLDELRQLEERLGGALMTTTVPLLLEGQRVEEPDGSSDG